MTSHVTIGLSRDLRTGSRDLAWKVAVQKVRLDMDEDMDEDERRFAGSFRRFSGISRWFDVEMIENIKIFRNIYLNIWQLDVNIWHINLMLCNFVDFLSKMAT